MSSKRFIQLVALVGAAGTLACSPVDQGSGAVRYGQCQAETQTCDELIPTGYEFPDSTLFSEVHAGR